MKVILHVTAGPATGRQIPMQSGERARFGSSDVADVCFADDREMADVHFEIECSPEHCVLRSLDGAEKVLLNNESVDRADLKDGDQIQAGATCLKAAIKGSPADTASDQDADTEEDNEPKLSAVELCGLVDLEEESIALFRPDHTPAAFIAALADHEQFGDAVRLQSMAMSRRGAIVWAHHCVRQMTPRDLSDDENAALETVERWLEQPAEPQRVAAREMAESLGYASAASCVAGAVAWSGGSMVPPDLPEVLPEAYLSRRACAAAILMSASEGDPLEADQRYRKILSVGKELATGNTAVLQQAP